MNSNLKYLTEVEQLAVDQFAKLMRDKLGRALVKMELFGSKIKGNFTETSDIDILIIARERTFDVMEAVADVTARLNIEYNLSLSPVVFSEQEFKVNADMSSPFSLAVEAEGVLL